MTCTAARVQRAAVAPAAPAPRRAFAAPLPRPGAAFRLGARIPASYNITFKMRDGTESTIPCADDQFILDAADDAGLDLPYSCRAGTCSTCCARVLSGEVDNAEQTFLDQEQMDKGFSLICVAYPLSDCTIVTHQEEALY